MSETLQSEQEDRYEVLEVLGEVHALFRRKRANEICRDIAIKSLFCAKRAVKYADEALRLESEVWSLVGKLYPAEWAGNGFKNFRYDQFDGELRYRRPEKG